MVCVGLSERDLLQWHDVTRKILGGPGKILGGQWHPPSSAPVHRTGRTLMNEPE